MADRPLWASMEGTAGIGEGDGMKHILYLLQNIQIFICSLLVVHHAYPWSTEDNMAATMADRPLWASMEGTAGIGEGDGMKHILYLLQNIQIFICSLLVVHHAYPWSTEDNMAATMADRPLWASVEGTIVACPHIEPKTVVIM